MTIEQLQIEIQRCKDNDITTIVVDVDTLQLLVQSVDLLTRSGHRVNIPCRNNLISPMHTEQLCQQCQLLEKLNEK